MGVCASSQTSCGKGRRGGINGPSIVKIIHTDGRLQEFKQPIPALHVLAQNPNQFLCNMESLNVDSYIQQLPETAELQLDQTYFLLPLSKSHIYLSLPDLCNLAIRASMALRKHESVPTFPVRSSSYSNFPADINGLRQVGSSSQLDRGNR